MANSSNNRADNYSLWYQNIILKADLAEHSSVKGSMIIKPYGYAIWERIQNFIRQRI